MILLSAMLLGVGCAEEPKQRADNSGFETPPRLTLPRLADAPYGPCTDDPSTHRGFCQSPPTFHDASPSPSTSDSTPRSRLHTYLSFRRFDTALEDLQGDDGPTPGDPAAANDLAVVHWLRALDGGQVEDLATALRWFEAAGELPEALFNRALLISHLGLRRGTLDAWDDYLRTAPSSPWRDEAEAHRARWNDHRLPPWSQRVEAMERALEDEDASSLHALVRQYPEDSRVYGETQLLGAWAEAHLAADSAKAAELLNRAQRLAAARYRVFGDRLMADGLDSLQRSSPTGQSNPLTGAAGHRAFAAGVRALTQDRDFEKAAADFEEAARWFHDIESPYGMQSFLERLRCLYQASRLAEVASGADALLSEVGRRPYGDLVGRSLWIQGSSLLPLGRASEALRAYDLALERFTEQGDTARQGILHVMVASAHGELGQLDDAWRHRLRALRLLAHRDSDRLLAFALAEAAYGFERMGDARTALLFQEEVFQLSLQFGSHLDRTIALRNRAGILGRLGRTGEALADARRAVRWARDIDNDDRRRWAEMNARFEEATWLRFEDPEAAIRQLSDVLATYRGADLAVFQPLVLHQRALARLQVDDVPGAEGDLLQAVEQLDLLRSHRWTAEHRFAFADGFEAIYSELARLYLRRDDALALLDTVERSRGRLLLDRLTPGGLTTSADFPLPVAPKPQPLDDLRPGLPDDVAFLIFHVLDDRLIVALLRSRGAVIVDSVDLASTDLLATIDRASAGLLRRSADGVASLGRLHRWLVGPIQHHLRPGETLVIVPHGPLYGVHFAALVDPATGRFLVQDHPLTISPSLNVFSHLSAASADDVAGISHLLLLGDPAFEGDLFPTLTERLPGAQRESEELARLVPGTTSLLGGEATRRSFLELLDQHAIVHVAAHAIADPSSPWGSRLALAPHGDESGVLHARDLAEGLAAGRTRLVVLAACRSADPRSRGGEGVSGWVWPLLAAGVPQVVATTLAVDDAASSRFNVALFRHLKAGGEPLRALRAAQLDSIEAERGVPTPSMTWAAYQLYGVPNGFHTFSSP